MPESLSTWLPLRHPFSILWPTAERLPLNQKQASCVRQTGVAIRTGAPKPDVSSLENFKRALLDAKSITYLPVPGVPQLIERLGLKEALAAKTTIPKTDLSSELVAKGEVELAIVPVTQAFTTPGVELAGPLPSEI